MIPYESLTAFLGLTNSVAQVTPLVIFFAILTFPFYVKKIHFTPILILLILYFLYTMFLSFGYILYEVFNYVDFDLVLRVKSFFRQSASFLMGMLLFLYLREIFVYLDEKVIFKHVLIASVPSILISIYQLIFLYSYEYRPHGMASEPSHFAEYMVFIVFSILLMKGVFSDRKSINMLLIIASVIAFMSTFSATGIIRLVLLSIGLVIFVGGVKLRLYFILLLVLILTSSFIFISTNESSYMSVMIFSLYNTLVDGTGVFSTSVVDRFFSFVFPLMGLFSSSVFIGYGFGGDSIHYAEYMPPVYSAVVTDIKSFGYSTTSLLGKVLVSSGFIGLFLYMFVFNIAFRLLKNKSQYNAVKAVIFAMLVYGCMGLGVFYAIYIWFWLAFVDSRIIRSKLKLEVTR